MITVNGKIAPNLYYYFQNTDDFFYPKSGSDATLYPNRWHEGSGTSNSTGNFAIDLYPAQYQIWIGKRKNEAVFYKDLNSGTDGSSVEFGGRNNYLSGTTWLQNNVPYFYGQIFY